MNDRQQELLSLVVEQHINKAEPVGSKFLVESGDLDWSEATVRNELRELEEAGYLTHPHTSAGRLPTSRGYQFYIENIMKPGSIKKNTEKELNRLWSLKDDKLKKMKIVGKKMSEESSSALIVAFNRDNLYYTGITNLFSQPEFSSVDEISSLSSVLDSCENYIDELFDVVREGKTYVLIGDNNPLSKDCSLITARIFDESLLALMGPLRMNYRENIALVEYVRKLVEK